MQNEVRELKFEHNQSRHDSRASLQRDQLASAEQGHGLKELIPNDDSWASSYSAGATTLDEVRNECESLICDSKHLFDNTSMSTSRMTANPVDAYDTTSDNRAAPSTASIESDAGSDEEKMEEKREESEEAVQHEEKNPGVARKLTTRTSTTSTTQPSTSSRKYGLTIDTKAIGVHGTSHRPPSPLRSIAIESDKNEEMGLIPNRQQRVLRGKGQFDELPPRRDTTTVDAGGRHLKLLTRGGFFIKHSRFGKPHMRFVLMSQDLRTIMWR